MAKKGPPKHQNKSAWKNVYHDTSKKSKQIAATEVSGVCTRCRDVIDWKIKYKKYKVLTQPKTCVACKQKTVKNSYHVYCLPCAGKADKCAKCGENKEVVMQPSLSAAEQASQDRQTQFELELLPERKRRTFYRLQEQGKLTEEALKKLEGAKKEDFFDFLDDDDTDSDNDSEPGNIPKDVTDSNDCDTEDKTSEVIEISDTINVNQELSDMNLDDNVVKGLPDNDKVIEGVEELS